MPNKNFINKKIEKVSKKIFVEQTKKEYGDFIEYIEHINQYLEKSK